VWFVAGLIILVLLGAYLATPIPKSTPIPPAAKRDSLVTALSAAKTVATKTQYATKEVSLAERQLASRVATRIGTLRDSLVVVRETLVAEQEDAHRLQAALLTATQEAESLAVVATQYLKAVDTLRAAYAEERRAMMVVLEKADTVIAYQETMIRALQQQRQCFGRRCPSRMTVALVGLVAGVLLTR
jgi:hypothetical protein